jgi:F-type H+-transporting ATPase subunit b
MKKVLLALMLATGVFAQEKQEKAEEPITKDEMLVWKWANFAILVAGAGYLLSKHLPPYFKSRTGEIQKDITEAQATKQAADKRSAEMDARLNSLAADIEKFRVQAKIEMEQEAARIRQETAHQIEKLQKQAEQEIESAGTLASRELHAYAAKLSLDLAEQRIRTRLDAATEAGLVDDFTKDLGSRN